MEADITILTLIVFAVFLLDWLAVGFSWRWVERIMKPLAMIMVILWTLTEAGWVFDTLLVMLLFAQAFGLAGDVFLLLKAHWFLSGLVSFLLGHLFYIGIAVWFLLNAYRISGFYGLLTWEIFLVTGIWMVVLLSFYGFVAPKSPRLTMPLTLWIPIQVYGWTLSVLVLLAFMVFFAASDKITPLVFLPIGAFLFYFSDSLLAYDRFKRKLPKVRVWIMVTYHLAQISLARGFLFALAMDAFKLPAISSRYLG